MKRPAFHSQQLIALFIIGCLALNFPVLALFSTEQMLWGVPVLYVYIFACWLILLILTATITQR